MTTDNNKALVRSLIDDLFTAGDLGAVDTYLANNFVQHDPPLRTGVVKSGHLPQNAPPREQTP